MERPLLAAAPLPLIAAACASGTPAGRGHREGRLPPCPATANCVSSQDPDPGHLVAPLPYAGSAEAAVAALKTIVARLPRARVVEHSGGCLRAEFRSLVFRFTDDVDSSWARRRGSSTCAPPRASAAPAWA